MDVTVVFKFQCGRVTTINLLTQLVVFKRSHFYTRIRVSKKAQKSLQEAAMVNDLYTYMYSTLHIHMYCTFISETFIVSARSTTCASIVITSFQESIILRVGITHALLRFFARELLQANIANILHVFLKSLRHT